MMKKTITIGIPAYNESANIVKLITSLLAQKDSNFSVEKIIVSSDGSTDLTVKKVKAIKNKKVVTIQNKDRKGIARGLNQIVQNCKSDILVTLDADIDIKDSLFLEKLIKPILNNNADLTSSAIAENFPKTFYGKILLVSMALKDVLFSVFKNGNNIYTCHGLARGYSKRFYKKIEFPVSIGNDMYSYLKCVTQNYKYVYAQNALAWYKLPQNHADHKKQSTRYFGTLREQEKFFASGIIDQEVKISIGDYFFAFVKSLPIIFRFPVHSIAYFFIQFYMQVITPRTYQDQTWSIATSTKSHE